MFRNKVLRTVFRAKREEIAREWRKSFNEELHNFYSSANIIEVFKLRSF
jgi:hypothetical protein